MGCNQTSEQRPCKPVTQPYFRSLVHLERVVAHVSAMKNSLRSGSVNHTPSFPGHRSGLTLEIDATLLELCVGGLDVGGRERDSRVDAHLSDGFFVCQLGNESAMLVAAPAGATVSQRMFGPIGASSVFFQPRMSQ